MMKSIKKLLCLGCAALLALSFAGCGGSTSEDNNTNDGGSSGVHQGEMTETDKYLVHSGASEYSVVLPSEYGTYLEVASEELVKLFHEATGATLPIVLDKDLTAGKNFISLGNTSQLEASGLEVGEEPLGTDGFVIQSKDENLYLYGNTEVSVMYAAYDLLERLLGFDAFFTDCYALDTNVRNLKFFDMKVTEIPDIEMRGYGYGFQASDPYLQYRQRVRYYYDFLIPVGKPIHNSVYYLEDGDDGYESLWYMDANRTQVCYTAHGDENAYGVMVETAFRTLKAGLIQYPDRNAATLSIMDNGDYCSCSACNAVIRNYGARSATALLFCNDVYKKVAAWFETAEGKPYARDFNLVFLAYWGVLEAPVTLNESTGKYEGNNGLKLEDGISVMYAPIETDFLRSFQDTSNLTYYEQMKKWSDFAGSLYLWIYNTGFNDYLMPYDSIDPMQKNYRTIVGLDTKWIFDQGQWNELGFSTGWSTLKAYLNAKLSWNCERDVVKLTDAFFAGYFGPAAEKMRDVYDAHRARSKYNIEVLNMGGTKSVQIDFKKETYWPKPLLKSLIEGCDAAEELVKTSVKDPDLYEQYQKHIAGERLSYLYLMIKIYSYNTESTQLNAYKNQFRADVNSCGATITAESAGAISDLYSEWNME